MKKEKIHDLKLSIIDYVVCFLAAILFSYVVSLLTGCFVLKLGLSGIFFVMSNQYVLLGTLVLTVISFIPFIYVMYLQFERNYVMKRLMGMRKAVNGNMENSHFMTKKEMIEEGYKVFDTLDALQTAEDGIILNLEEGKNRTLKTTISPEVIHTLILGTTGSGKTAGYIIPTIKALANTKTKPSFLFTDPKGELNEKTAWYLKEQGYDIKVMDFRHPERSLRWNPLAYAFEKYRKAQEVVEETIFKDDKYYFRGVEYDADNIEGVEQAEEQRLEDEAFEEIQSIVYALCQVNPRDPIWDNGARALVQAVILAMLEDSLDDDCDMTIDKFCFYNVAKICNKTSNNCESLKEYFRYRKPTSLAVQYSGMVLNAPDKQQGSYMSSVAEKLLMFNDRGICNMTSGVGEINVKSMDEKPTAIYLVLPDEKEGRHPLGSLFVSEAYKKLVEKAVINGGKLNRNVYFMMDEFGNMPKIEGIASMFTVGRSRGIIQIPVIQSYSQIINKYGEETAKTIFGNCNTEIFIGAKDEVTCESFSKKLGNYSVLNTNVTGQKRAFEHNYSESLKERPLMYPRELTLLNNKKEMGNVVVVNQGYSPTLGKFTPYFKSKIFENKTVLDDGRKPRALDESNIFYDFEQRARIIKSGVEELSKLIDEENSQNEEIPSNRKKQEEIIPKTDVADILSKITPFAEQIDKKFTDDMEENKKIIEEIIEFFRSERAIAKLNQVLKLKTQFDQALTIVADDKSTDEKM